MTEHGFSEHNHAQCVSGTLEVVVAYCAQNGLQLTAVRRRVLEILLEAHQALGAYQILERLRAEGLGSQPPVAYRALDFLVQHGFAHKIERLNAFVACLHPGETHAPIFMICRECNTISETVTDLSAGRLGDAAQAAGFEIERIVVEAEGLCPNCKAAA